MEPSLDISDLVTLLDDRDPQTMFDEWLATVQTIIPSYQPVTGSVDVAVAEALCLTVADLIYAVNRLPGVVTEAILTATDIPRHPGTPGTGQVLLTLDGPRTLSVPLGTRMVIEGIEWQTTEIVSVTAASTITVPIATIEATGLGNSIIPGVGVDMLDQIPAVVAAETTGTFGGGVDPESDESYRSRLGLILARSHAALGLPSSFASYAAGIVDVGRATAIDNWDITGVGDPGDDAGHTTVVVWGYGIPIDAKRLEQIATEISDRALANLQVHITNAAIINIDVDCPVRLAPGVDETATLAAVEAAIRSALSPMLWTWGERVTADEMGAIAARVSGVDYAVDPTIKLPDDLGDSYWIDLGPIDLPQAATITVTVAAPL